MGGFIKKISAILFTVLLVTGPASADKASANKINAKALFSSYPSRFAEINTAALNNVLKGFYLEAVNEYSRSSKKKPDAFTFLRDEYKGPARSRESVDECIDGIKKQIQLYASIQQDLKNIASDYRSSRDLKKLQDSLTPLINIRNEIAEYGRKIKQIDSSLYISCLSKSVLGVDAEWRTGIVGAIDAHISRIIEDSKQAVSDEAKACADQVALQLKAEIFPQKTNCGILKTQTELLEQKAILLKDIHSLYGLLKNEGTKTGLTQREAFSSEMDFLASLCTQSRNIYTAVEALNGIQSEKLSKPKNPAAALRAGTDEYSAKLVLYANSFFGFGKTATDQKRSRELTRLNSMQEKEGFTKTFTESIFNTCSSIEKLATASSIEFWKESAAYYAQCSLQLLAMDENEISLLSGLIEKENEIKFPSKVLTSVPVVNEIIQKDIKLLNECNVKLSDGYAYRSNFLKDSRTIDDTISRLKKTNQRLAEISEQARTIQLEAVLAKNEVDLFYNRALREYNSQQYAAAMETQQKAKLAYENYITELNNDGDIKNQLYHSLNLLRDNIIEKEKPVFFREQRNMKAQAKRSYEAGNFENASLTLTQALEKRSLWEKLTDVMLDPDVELEHLRDYVNTALEIKTGREISPYDSKAPEMLQNLSLARQGYNRATELIKQGKNEEALKQLAESKEKVLAVKNYFPRNQQASLLNLRIEQIADKNTFNETFPLRVEKCVSDLKVSGAPAMQAYSDLLDLYEINPSYPNLKKIITNAEYDLGLKMRPADSAKIKKASELAALAKQSLDKAGRDEVLLEHARNLASQAHQLNPADSEAVIVLDEIARRKGEQSAVTLSAEDEDLYSKALKDYRNANYADALEKINRLLKTQGNERSAKIIRLKENVERKNR